MEADDIFEDALDFEMDVDPILKESVSSTTVFVGPTTAEAEHSASTTGKTQESDQDQGTDRKSSRTKRNTTWKPYPRKFRTSELVSRKLENTRKEWKLRKRALESSIEETKKRLRKLQNDLHYKQIEADKQIGDMEQELARLKVKELSEKKSAERLRDQESKRKLKEDLLNNVRKEHVTGLRKGILDELTEQLSKLPDLETVEENLFEKIDFNAEEELNHEKPCKPLFMSSGADSINPEWAAENCRFVAETLPTELTETVKERTRHFLKGLENVRLDNVNDLGNMIEHSILKLKICVKELVYEITDNRGAWEKEIEWKETLTRNEQRNILKFHLTTRSNEFVRFAKAEKDTVEEIMDKKMLTPEEIPLLIKRSMHNTFKRLWWLNNPNIGVSKDFEFQL